MSDLNGTRTVINRKIICSLYYLCISLHKMVIGNSSVKNMKEKFNEASCGG